MSETKKIYMYSLDEENYLGETNDQHDAIIEAVADNDLSHGETIWISEMKLIKAPDFDSFMSVDDIFERADQYFADNIGNEDPLFDPKKEHYMSLMTVFNATWAAWIKLHPEVMRIYYQAIDPVEIEIDPEHIQIADGTKQ